MIRRFYRFTKILLASQKIRFSFLLSKFSGSTNEVYINCFDIIGSKLIFLPTSNFLLLSNCFIFSYDLNILNFAFNNFNFSEQKLNTFYIEKLVNNHNIRVIITSKEDYELFYEIFYLKPYSFNATKQCNVIDVGMNVGYATLFFSTFEQVNKVYAYELVDETFNRACGNFNFNQELVKKIEAYSFGLSDADRRLAIPFAHPGSVGASVFELSSNINTSGISDTIVNLRNIIPILDSIVKKNKLPLVVKLDCEGSEYELINAIDSADLFKYVYIMMIEWHFKGADSIATILKRNGFVTFDNVVPAHIPIGFIYAVNMNLINV